MKQIEIKATIERLIDTFLYAGKVSIELREKGLIKERIKTFLANRPN